MVRSAPVPNHGSWKHREDEVLGWQQYLVELVAWCSQGSPVFSREVEQASRWSAPIAWRSLSSDQQSRAIRLFAILKAAFAGHGRISLLIAGFQEGIDVSWDVASMDAFGNRATYMALF